MFSKLRYLFGRKADTVMDRLDTLALFAPDEPLADRIMAAYNLRGLAGYTADEVADKLELGILTIRPRVTELFQAGKLRKTQCKRKNRSGINAVVLVSTRIPSARDTAVRIAA